MKIEILGAVLELPAKQHCQSSPFTSKLVANYSFYVKSIATCAPTFFGYIISVVASVATEETGACSATKIVCSLTFNVSYRNHVAFIIL